MAEQARNKRRLVLGGASVVLVVAAAGLFANRVVFGRGRSWPGFGNRAPALATVQVQRGDLDVAIKTRGEFKAKRTVTLSAPTTVTDVKLVKVAKSGVNVKPNDIIVEMDAMQEQTRLQEQQSGLRQVDAELEKTRAQARIQDEQDRLDLAQAEFDVEKAKLEVSKQEIVSEIEAGKAKLALENAERKYTEVKARIEAHKRSQEAELDQNVQKRKKMLNDVELAKANVQRLTIRSPIAGVLALLPNWRARQGFGGSSVPEFKAGDRAWPGAAIAEIPDLSTMYVELMIEETERGRVAADQVVRLKVDALADRSLQGKIQSISPMAQISFDNWPPQKTFRGMVALEAMDARLRPGMSAGAEVVVDRLRNVILIPVRASFDRGGRVIAYVKNGRRFEPREIVTGHKSEAQIEVKQGLKPGETVALEEPADARKAGS